MEADVLFAGMPVRSLNDSLAWYESLFGRPPDIVPNENEVMWNVVGAGWVYVVEDAERAGRSLVAVAVSNLDEALAHVNQRGIRTDAVEMVGDAGRKAALTDPDGNSLTLIEVRAEGSSAG